MTDEYFLFLPTPSIFWHDLPCPIMVGRNSKFAIVDKSWLSSAQGKAIESYVIFNFLSKKVETLVSKKLEMCSRSGNTSQSI